MPEISPDYAKQIDRTVSGFMQVWVQFEAMLPAEIARVQGPLEGMLPEDAGVRDYELFYRISSLLSTKESVTMGEMSAALSFPLSKATRTADWLVAHGFIQRIPDKEDRRIVRISLTPKGMILHRAVENSIRERVSDLLACLSIEEREHLFDLIGKVVSSAAKDTGE